VVADLAKAKRVAGLAAKGHTDRVGTTGTGAFARQAAQKRAGRAARAGRRPRHRLRSRRPSRRQPARAGAGAQSRVPDRQARRRAPGTRRRRRTLSRRADDRPHRGARSLARRSRSRDPGRDPAGADQTIRGKAGARAPRALPGEDRRGGTEAGGGAGELGPSGGHRAAPAAAPVGRP
jgi:hypothetical protein